MSSWKAQAHIASPDDVFMGQLWALYHLRSMAVCLYMNAWLIPGHWREAIVVTSMCTEILHSGLYV